MSIAVAAVLCVIFYVHGTSTHRPEVPLVTFASKPIDPKSDTFSYLAFQFFTLPANSHMAGDNLPSYRERTDALVKDLVTEIGTTGSGNRMLAFMVGPLSLDDTDQATVDLIDKSFATAEKYDVAVGFHIDDSMFWELDANLKDPADTEWVDWARTPYTGRQLFWSPTPTAIAPQLCFNSAGVVRAVRERGALIAREIKKNIDSLIAEHKGYLFAGVISGNGEWSDIS